MQRLAGSLFVLVLAGAPGCEKKHDSTTPVDADADDEGRWGLEDSDEVPGGWSEQDVADASVVAAAEVAMTGLRDALSDPSLDVLKIRAAQTQVVAGVNYRLVLEVDGSNGPRTIAATVYEPAGGGAPELRDHRIKE